ncbi:MAG: SUMF1/EgtB/PvdO family nonheme iron enzyme [Rhodospirillaceae bacterium]|nr:SUMF1/EgtB/PvdO family nonheme iron enzyme [Rhodospirillaceae bacterium]MBT5081810.1 SUMF1/EgtB/PvdO family nonheme iron enzyme [Rhodospirillaceae bacterium]MBT5524952.1 SUMF1/EgtB/PvdO family nonheme iron enzyme [Rhodospirillaceae bacterium]MBT6984296.1 SUMF1/EgtB/PvdO family nonheme iron enzyme [Rhodospirillaceae bacterium]MBT7666067.1 SUMF1/EgtB/PvdO family nonheme iron enzyme [Rhodospirillaceae bacterium]
MDLRKTQEKDCWPFVLIAILTLSLVPIGVLAAATAARGLTVELRVNEDKDAPVSSAVQLYGASYALVIGNDAYGGAWPRLSNAVKDAQLVAKALEAKGFSVSLKTNLKHRDMVDAFENFFLETGQDPTARLFLWYAGHGHSEGGEGFLVPIDAPDTDASGAFLRRSLSLRRMGEYVRGAKALHIFSVFDSCFSGTIFNVGRAKPPPAITRATTRPVVQFLTSGDAGQEVSDDGTFRKLFIRALNGQVRADANGDGYLAASELGLYMADAITNYSNGGQTPRNGKLNDPDLDQGDFVFQVATPPVTGAGVPPASTGASAGSGSAEIVFWQSIMDSKRASDFEAYLQQFPKGAFAALARSRAAAFGPPKVAAPRPGDVFKDCDDCPEMVIVPAGRFHMGDLSGDGDNDEKPVHTVEISAAFAVGKFEVTWSEWNACVHDGGCDASGPEADGGDEGWGGSRRPVINVNWDDAKVYVAWLRRRTGLDYRLLSEAEWEYVARAGGNGTYSFGDDESALCQHGNGADMSTDLDWRNKNCNDASGKRTVQVGSFQPNAFGLYDVHGNVWEWVEDCWHDGYQGAPTDGSAWKSGGDCRKRVLRGGSWGSRPWALRTVLRNWNGIGKRKHNLGFRLARTLSR